MENNLEVLRMSENPGTSVETDYKLFSIAYLAQLKYLDYELINETEREAANEKYKEEIAEKDNQKAAEKADER